MPAFSPTSVQRLTTCHTSLQAIAYEAIKYVNFTVICGHRDEAAQILAVKQGKSKTNWPNSKHNRSPSLAMDVAPWLPDFADRIDWNDQAAFARLAGYLERVADEMKIKIRWGGDWNENWRTRDEQLIDMPHIELVIL